MKSLDLMESGVNRQVDDVIFAADSAQVEVCESVLQTFRKLRVCWVPQTLPGGVCAWARVWRYDTHRNVCLVCMAIHLKCDEWSSVTPSHPEPTKHQNPSFYMVLAATWRFGSRPKQKLRIYVSHYIKNYEAYWTFSIWHKLIYMRSCCLCAV